MALALVTGGNRGIGLAIACKLAQNGYDIAIAARDSAENKKAADTIRKFGVSCWAFKCDVRKKKDLDKLKESMAVIGPLDILINDAGVAYGKNFLDDSDQEIDDMLEVNLRGLIFCTKAFLEGMVKKRRGTIINISSGAGRYGIPGLAVYCATKSAVIGFTQALAQEVEEDGVKVFAVCPGGTDTDMWRSLFPGGRAQYQPEDVAIEVIGIINDTQLRTGTAVDVRKHI